jgi:hypothetical protein
MEAVELGRRLTERMRAAALAALARAAPRLLAASRDVWPIETGESRDALSTRVEEMPSAAALVTASFHPAAQYIHRSGDPVGQAWADVRAAAEAEAVAIASDIRAEVCRG